MSYLLNVILTVVAVELADDLEVGVAAHVHDLLRRVHLAAVVVPAVEGHALNSAQEPIG